MKKYLMFFYVFAASMLIGNLSSMAQGNSLAFDGTTQYAQVVNPTYPGTNLTIEAWIKTTSTSGAAEIAGYGSTASTDEVMELRLSGGKVQFGINQTSWSVVTSSSSVNSGKWTHVAAVKSGTNITIYINGIIDATGIIANANPSVDRLTIGNLFYNNLLRSYYFGGSIDEVRIWNTARSQAEIQSSMCTPLTTPYSANLVSYFNFDNSSGAVLDDLIGVNDATIYNTPVWAESYAMVIPSVSISGVTPTEFTLNWSAPTIGTVDNYIVEISTNATFTSPIIGSPFTVANTEFSKNIGGLTAGTPYFYRVCANKSSVSGQGGFSFHAPVLNSMTPPGNALKFDGVNDNVSSANINIIGAQPRTLEFWYKKGVTSASYSHIINWGTHSPNQAFGCYLASNSVLYFYCNSTDYNTGYVIDDKWHHIAITYDGTVVSSFVDGIPTPNSNQTKVLSTTSGPLVMGTNPSFIASKYNDGTLDEVRVWNVARNQSQIQSDMLNPITNTNPQWSNLVINYTFDEGVAGGTNTGVTTLVNSSSYPNHAVLSNFALTGSSSNWVESYATVVPTAIAATNVTDTSFSANWTGIINGTVDNYVLEVSSNATFTAPISGSPFILANNVFTRNITSLTVGTPYFYRVRAEKSTIPSQGQYSNVISVFNSMTAPGNGLHFDGTDDYVTLKNNFPDITNNFTIEMWVKPSATLTLAAEGTSGAIGTSGQRYVVFPTYGATSFGAGHVGAGVSVGTNGIQVFEHSSAYMPCLLSYATTINKWTHVAIVYTNKTPSLYINGILVRTGLQSSQNYIHPSNVLGGTSYGWYGGSVDELKYWKTARTSAEISGNMFAPISSPTSDLISYYQFDHGNPGALNTGISSLCDASSHDNYGNLTNLALTGNTSNWVESYAMVAPIATAATSIVDTSFTANWTASEVGVAEKYLLDVSTVSDFSSFVLGYNQLDCGANFSQTVVGLTSGTPYFYRVRAEKASVSGQGIFRNQITLTTLLRYTISSNVYPINTGSTTGDGSYLHGDTVVLFATANTGYSFTNWTENGDTASTNFSYVFPAMANRTLVANFIIKTFSLDYTAGTNGSITGTANQTVNYGANGAEVTAVANANYHFVNWSDGSTTNPRTDLNVTANIAVTANFAINTFTLDYTAGANGSITGTASQTVNYGANGTEVTAVANANYHFANWSDGSTINPRTDLNVTANIAVTANFAINTFTLDYTAGTNGSITGTANQTVNYGANGTQVTAVPNANYHFVNWSDGSTTNPRTDSNVTANINVSANFAINQYTISASVNPVNSGTITGDGNYNYGENVSLSATPNTGYTFVNWTENGDTVSTAATYSFSAESDRSLVANFKLNVSINEEVIGLTYRIYPNPVLNELIIEMDKTSENMSFEIFNAVGQIVLKGELLEKTHIQTSGFNPGVYLIKLCIGNRVEFKKIVKE